MVSASSQSDGLLRRWLDPDELASFVQSNLFRRAGAVPNMKVRPLHDRIIVERLEEGEQVVGGIIIPDTAKEKPQQGKVIAAGHGKVEGRWQGHPARRQGRGHDPLRQVLRPGNQDRRRGTTSSCVRKKCSAVLEEVAAAAGGKKKEPRSPQGAFIHGKANHLR